MKLRQCQIVIDVDKLNVNINAIFDMHSEIKFCAYAVHHEGDIRLHYHIYLHFGSASVDIQQVAKWFNLGYKDENGNEHDGTQFINKIKCGWVAVTQYLTHGKDCINMLTR